MHPSTGRESGSQIFPVGRGSATFEAPDDPAALVEEDHVWLVVGADRTGQRALGIVDLGPAPAVSLEEVAGRVRSVRDVQADVLVLRVGVDERCVGDRLAIAGESPRRPDVDEDRRAPEVGERDGLAVERRSRERAAGRRRLRRCGLLTGAATGQHERDRERGEGAWHAPTLAAGDCDRRTGSLP